MSYSIEEQEGIMAAWIAQGAARYADEDAELAETFLPLVAETLTEDWDSPEDEVYDTL